MSAATVSFLVLREGTDTDDQPVQASQRVSHRDGLTQITLDPAAQRQAGIQTQELHVATWSASLTAYGTVLDAQPLADLASRYTTARAQEAAARSRAESARLALARARTLFEDQQNMSTAQLQAAQSAYRTEEAGLRAVESELAALAAQAQLAWGPVLKDALVKDRAPLTWLASGQEQLLQVTLRPGETAGSTEGAVAQPDGGARIPLRYLSPAARTDPRIQGASLLFTVPAGAGLLPGMTVRVWLPGTRALAGALIPSSAVVWTQGVAWAYFRSGQSAFVRRPVPTGSPQPDGYVVSGATDSEVVVQGAQMLLSEEQRAEARVSD
jgi:hypothetical protein